MEPDAARGSECAADAAPGGRGPAGADDEPAPAVTTGVNGTLKINSKWVPQVGIGTGTETLPWNSRSISIPGYNGR